MCAHDEAFVLTQEGLTEAFKCTTGVKQGCPASPLLFGLYIDAVEELLKKDVDTIDAPTLGSMLVAILLFADDIGLFSYSPQGLQKQLDNLWAFCHERGLKVNVAKTKIVVFEARQSSSPAFFYDGQIIERVQMFKYLGIAFHATRGLSCALEHLCNTARKAVFGVHGRCHELHLQDPAAKCMLSDAVVRPILNYGCEVWAIIGGKTAIEQLERVQLSFLRQLLGLPTRTSSKLIYAEFGRLPVHSMWLQQSLSYLQHLQNLGQHRLCRAVYDADVAQGLGWYDGLISQLRSHGVRLPRRGQDCDLSKIAAAVRDKIILKAMTPNPDNHLQQGYFSFKAEFRFEPYISKAKNKHHRRVVAMFRVGTHWLQVCRGRYVALDYQQGTCPTCSGTVEDEVHALFHCPDYHDQRAKFADLFLGQCGQNLRAFLVHNPCHRLALFLIACKSASRQGRTNAIDMSQSQSMLMDTQNDREPDLDLGIEYSITEVDTYDSD